LVTIFLENKLFKSFKAEKIDLLVIAGEASGDEHAAHLVNKLLKRHPNLQIAVMGGENLKVAGAFFLFDLVEHAVVGVFEVLKNYRFFKSLFSHTLKWIHVNKPKAILLIDYPGFNLRLAGTLRKKGLSNKGGGTIKVLQYISPQLWAWKPKRRFKMANVLDSLAVIFPFEVGCYYDVSLPVSFVGHPFAEEDYLSPVKYDQDGSLLLLPGSRIQPIQRILPVFLDAAERIIHSFPELKIEIPVPNAQIKECVEKIISAKPHLENQILIPVNADKVKARAALMSSGTMSFTCALAGLPGVIAYKAHPLTYWLGRLLIKVPYLGMANLLLPDNPPYQEFIQFEATAENLSKEIEEMLVNDDESRRFGDCSLKLKSILQGPQELGAVDWVATELGIV
jgi:lipid-A-disaccharide synthase